jgi:hypothetical protein
MIIQGLPRVLFEPTYALFFWLVTAFVFYQYRRMERLEEERYGRAKNTAFMHTLTALGYGVVGGLIGSFIFVFLGITLSIDDIKYVWPLALALMLINPRLICFSYAGGIIAVSSVLFGWPAVNVPGLMALVAILHVVEGLLVWISGAQCASPVYVRKDNRNVGGYLIQRFWPIPTTIILAVTLPEAVAGGIEMPEWWPLIPPPGVEGPANQLNYVMVPVMAALGYGDLAVAAGPEERSNRSAGQLVLFSTVLLVLALLAVGRPLVGLLAGLFSAGGHELMSQLGSRSQLSGEPQFTQPSLGVRVLDVFPDSVGAELGFSAGDVIFAVNGLQVTNRREFRQALAQCSFYLELRTRSKEGITIRESSRYRHDPEEGAELGLILVPEGHNTPHVELKARSFVESILGRWHKSYRT